MIHRSLSALIAAIAVCFAGLAPLYADPPAIEAAPANQLSAVGLPAADSPVTVLRRIGYTAGYSTQKYCPLWTVYRIKSAASPVSEGRPSAFSPDPDLPPAHQIDTREYSHSGYSRGHMAPNFAISFSYGREAQIETFYTTNIIPQVAALNGGLWEELERIESTDYARRYDGVLVIDGPIFDPPIRTIGHLHKISVPRRCYKIIARWHGGRIDALAFVMPQDAAGKGRPALERYLVSIDAIERATGVRFLTGLPAAEQASLKSAAAARMW